jgi:hypothetical protein
MNRLSDEMNLAADGGWSSSQPLGISTDMTTTRGSPRLSFHERHIHEMNEKTLELTEPAER